MLIVKVATLFFVAVIFLCSCAHTSAEYREQGVLTVDGFSEEKNSAGVYKVRYTGRGFDSVELVEQFLDRRCAELTLKEGFDWFTYYTKSRADVVLTMAKPAPSLYGVIHMHKGPVGEDGYDARKIVNSPIQQETQTSN